MLMTAWHADEHIKLMVKLQKAERAKESALDQKEEVEAELERVHGAAAQASQESSEKPARAYAHMTALEQELKDAHEDI